MANTSEPAHASYTLSQWVDKFFDDTFFQTNDEAAVNTMNEDLAQGFTATVNHDQFSRQDFIEATKKFRSVNITTVQSIKEIQAWDAPDGSGGGCVAKLVFVKDTNKETGASTESSTLMVSNVQVVGGKRMLFSLTEVFKQGV
ncbi:hypothetical protein DHEL01_v205932 [Diaporthe helianthi]|uniref:SnoaL-like domain-containing protein n=1 Tax=Diaporthe helianthi TaxID=158607 RepID=A0A2P5HZJ7_DIAHE|nr:hypothetical protein DHEL01_v205932 [Diaporthe helianthi]